MSTKETEKGSRRYLALIGSTELDDYQVQALRDWQQEFEDFDRIYNLYTYHHFVSKSKGRRYHANGSYIVRKRSNWKEVELIRYRTARFYTWEKAPFDCWATETLPGWQDATHEVMARVRADAARRQ